MELLNIVGEVAVFVFGCIALMRLNAAEKELAEAESEIDDLEALIGDVD